MIEIKNLSFSYDKTSILKDLTACFKPCTVSTIEGTNGVGKSTLSKLIMGIEHPTSGSIFFKNQNISKLKTYQLAKSIYYCFQDATSQLFCDSVFDEVSFALKYQDFTAKQIEEKVFNILRIIGLLEYKNQHPLKLSQGQKQRLALACGFVLDVDYMILDEPTASLDSKNIQNLITIINQYKKTTAFIIITHDRNFVESISDSHYVLKEGSLYVC